MKKYILIVAIVIIALPLIILFLSKNNIQEIQVPNDSSITPSTKESNGFKIDEVYHSPNNGDIHYSVYIPEDYNNENEYPLYITLPGYEGLYFQGIGVNLEDEDFAYEAKKINPNMIILAPQLNDWGTTSANQTIALIEYYKENYNISKVYANGFSGGGETMSLVMGNRADLIDAYLHVSSKWDGEYDMTVKYRVPVYFFIGESDEYYSSTPTKNAYNTLHSLYEKEGLSKEEIDKLLILDIKDKEYFTSKGMNNQHAGGGLVAHDKEIMNWLLTK